MFISHIKPKLDFYIISNGNDRPSKLNEAENYGEPKSTLFWCQRFEQAQGVIEPAQDATNSNASSFAGSRPEITFDDITAFSGKNDILSNF